jgi:hypothetical protein
MFSLHLVSVFGLFGVGGSILIAGIVTQMSLLMYISGAFSGAGILLSIYLCIRERSRARTYEPQPPQPRRIYRDPGMKKNKSDTNLELMGAAPHNTTDDVASVIV